MEGPLILILIILIGVIIFLMSRLSLQKHYYEYKSNLLDNVEESSTTKIKELQESVETLNKAAYTDITTKIGNRDYFIKRTIEVLERDANKDFTLIGFKIANIGKVNQMFGPSEGDRLITYAAQRLRMRATKGSVYAIVQSNQFALLLPSQEDAEILSWVEGMTSDMENCTDLFDIELKFGIYKLTDKSEKISEMLSRMVLAQRSVMDQSKTNYVFFDAEMNRQYEENQKMCQEMEQALAAKKFVMYLQPMVDLHTSKIYSAEALVRWEHETKGLLSPYAFLPIFENTNLMLNLDYYMWEEACKTIRRWVDNKLEPLPVMLNISPIHLTGVEFLPILTALLDKYKLQKNMLVLELPERALTSGTENAIQIVKEIEANGYTVCIDNFGGLHSPINLLRDLPISMVKLDRKFLSENSKNEDGETILRYLIAMAKELDLTVLVEGVETIQQVTFLKEIGCDIAQGYYFSKPVSLREFDKLNKKVSRFGFRANEYYPTFTDMEQGVDIMEKMSNKKF